MSQRVTLAAAGSPVGVQHAWQVGQYYRDTTTGGLWRSFGMEKADWCFLPSTSLEQILVVSELGAALGTLTSPLSVRALGGYEFVSSLKGIITVTFDPNTGESGIWRGQAETGEWFLLEPGLTATDPPLGTFIGETEDSYFVIAYAAG